MQLLAEIRTVSVDGMDLHDAVVAITIVKLLKTEYEVHGLPPPDWLDARLTELQEEVKNRKRDYLQRALKSAQARQSTLKTAEEKRKDVQEEIERLQKALAQ